MAADVLVVGAGLGGLTSARELIANGCRVTVLEARDRVGGRIHTDTFPGTSTKVDLGAEWGSPDHHLALGAELQRYGLEFEEPPPARQRVWRLGQRTRQFQQSDGRACLTEAEGAELESALKVMGEDIRALGFEDAGESLAADRLDVTFAQYVDSLNPSAAVSEMIHSLAFSFAGGDPEQYSAWMLLRELAGYDRDPEALFGDDYRISGGSSSLPLAIAEELGDRVRLGVQVKSIRDDDPGVSVSTVGGGELRASAVVVAVPINVLAGIEFSDAAINERIDQIGGPHAGAASKVWLRSKKLPASFQGLAWPELPEVYAHANDPGLIAAFGMPRLVGEAQPRTMERLLHLLLPDPEVEAVFGHDWCEDPFARGTWLAVRPGQQRPVAALRDWKSRILFAGADLDTGWAGWMDGAITSGKRAAAEAVRQIGFAA